MKQCTKCNQLKSISDFGKDKSNPDGKNTRCFICKRNADKAYRDSGRKRKAQNRTWDSKYNTSERGKKRSQKFRLNNRLSCHLRSRLSECVSKNARLDLSFYELLGCDKDSLRNHLESQFTDGMSWDNYGMFGWHIEHIIPVSSFDLSNIEDVKICFHYTNLQPLWAKDNLRKGAKIEHLERKAGDSNP